METPATQSLLDTADKLMAACQKASVALHNKTQECERYKKLVASYEENQEQLLKEIKLLKALTDKEAA